MTNFPKATVTATNTKTGTTGFAVCVYNRTNDGKRIVEVFTGRGKNAHWDAENVQLSS